MSNPLACTFEEFKRMSMEFHNALPTMNLDEMDNAYKCLVLGYMNMSEDMWQHSAFIVLDMNTRKYLEREFQLLQNNF